MIVRMSWWDVANVALYAAVLYLFSPPDPNARAQFFALVCALGVFNRIRGYEDGRRL